MHLRMVLPHFPEFCLDDLRECLPKLNPLELPVEVYIPATRMWELFVDDHTTVTFTSGTREILVSLRPAYRLSFKVKPGLGEILSRQSQQRPAALKRAAEELTSPRKAKLPRNLDAPRILFSSPSKTQSTAPHSDFDFEDETSSSPSPTPLPLPNTAPVREKRIRFPAHWPARVILEKTSAYVQQRAGNHGKFAEIFKRVYGTDHYPKTTASLLPQFYPAAYSHFRSLDYDEQMTIAWSTLINRFKITKKSSVGMQFIRFIHPAPPPSEYHPSLLQPISPSKSLEDHPPQSSSSPGTHTLISPPSGAFRQTLREKLDNIIFRTFPPSNLRDAEHVPNEDDLVRQIELRVIHYSQAPL